MLVSELSTWGNWIRNIDKKSEGLKVLESGLDIYILVHKGPYIENQRSFIFVYKMLNIKRDNKDIPCTAKGINPCYNTKFCCATSKKSKLKTNFRENFETYAFVYPQDIPPKDFLLIKETVNTFYYSIQRRTECYVLPQEKLSCPREISGNIKKIEGKYYNINLSLSNGSNLDLLD